MSKNTTVMTDFMRDAVREKATRELAALTHRSEAFGGVERVRGGLHTVTADLAAAAPAIVAIAADAGVSLKLKKLRKIVEEAHMIATEIGDALGGDDSRDALAASKQAILDALKAAGLDPAAVLGTPVAAADAE
ncbi:MAG: hypothetical protein WCJ30_15430 [Deltaproteobacteria bacterium]